MPDPGTGISFGMEVLQQKLNRIQASLGRRMSATSRREPGRPGDSRKGSQQVVKEKEVDSFCMSVTCTFLPSVF
jgi:hypothetical protein